jgi:hypothetical protein
VALEERGVATVEREAFPVDDEHRDLGAVLRPVADLPHLQA